VEPLVVTLGSGRGPDVVLAADGTFGALPVDDDVPAVLIDQRAGPHATEGLFTALRARGFAHALIVGPRDPGDGTFGGVVVGTDRCLCEQAVHLE
jgi:hypothetical protein